MITWLAMTPVTGGNYCIFTLPSWMFLLLAAPDAIRPEPRPCAFVTDEGKLPMLGMPKSADGRC